MNATVTPIARNWRNLAACAAAGPGLFFGDDEPEDIRTARETEARQVCAQCPVRRQCLAEAVEGGIRFGTWGGMAERERERYARRLRDRARKSALLENAS